MGHVTVRVTFRLLVLRVRARLGDVGAVMARLGDGMARLGDGWARLGDGWARLGAARQEGFLHAPREVSTGLGR